MLRPLNWSSLGKSVKFKQVIIVGAGIAGLAACSRLKEYGFDPLILEARDRVGGRIHTTNELGIPISKGAAWIHGVDDNPMTQLAKQFHIHMKSVDPEQFVIFDQSSKLISLEIVQTFNRQFEGMLQQAKQVARKNGKDISLANALSNLVASAKFSSVENDLLRAKLNFFQGYIGDDYQFLSALNWDQEEIWPGDNCFLTDTYCPIIDGLASNCDIQLNAVVTEIRWQNQTIEVITEHDHYIAEAVIITLPLGVLKTNSVLFTPPLPQNKSYAIQRIGMGLLNVIVMRFPNVFWPQEKQGMSFAQFDANTTSFFLNLYALMQEPILIGYCGGDKARYLESIADDIAIQRIMESLRNEFGRNIPNPESYFITHWASDPFSYGSYSYAATGSSLSDFEALAEPLANRLFFAGEATLGKHLATTHGAYLSGIREAERIKQLFY